MRPATVVFRSERAYRQLALAAFTFVIGLGLTSCSRLPPPASKPLPSSVKLLVVSTNDLHGQLDPYELPLPGGQGVLHVGGAAALAATVAELRAAHPGRLILLDAGDFMQGSLLSNTFEGAPVRELFGLLQYDAVVIGNHEFDYGAPGPQAEQAAGADQLGALKALLANASFPLLSANISGRDGQTPLPGLRRSLVLERQGVRVGIIGLTTPETAVTTMPQYVEDLRFAPLLSTVTAEARALRSQGVEVVLLLAHAGGDCDGPPPRPCRGELFEDLLDQIEPGLIDGVVAGHSHRYLHHRYQGLPVVEACTRGGALARLEIEVRRKAGKVTVRGRPLPALPVCHSVLAATGSCRRPPAGAALGQVIPNPALAHHELAITAAKLIAGYRQRLGDREREVLATCARPLSRLHGQSETGALLAAALLAAVPGADLALLNGGGIRADLPQGPLTYEKLFKAFPFDNRLATVQLSGQQLYEIFAHLLGRGRGLFALAGIRVLARCGPSPTLSALVTAEGQPLRPEKTYTAVINDFLLSGGDGLGPFFDRLPAQAKRIYPARLVRDEVARFLKRQRGLIGDSSRPLISQEAPPIQFVDGPCAATSRGPSDRCLGW